MRDGTISQIHWKQVKRRFERRCAVLKDVGFRPYLDFPLGDEWEIFEEDCTGQSSRQLCLEDFDSILPTRLKMLRPRKNKTGGRKPAKA
jgi:hypothetical protein